MVVSLCATQKYILLLLICLFDPFLVCSFTAHTHVEAIDHFCFYPPRIYVCPSFFCLKRGPENDFLFSRGSNFSIIPKLSIVISS
jgi:hypothetical protein